MEEERHWQVIVINLEQALTGARRTDEIDKINIVARQCATLFSIICTLFYLLTEF